jgi:hypothetical protein
VHEIKHDGYRLMVRRDGDRVRLFTRFRGRGDFTGSPISVSRTMPPRNSFMGYDPVNEVTLIVWTNLTISLEGKLTANSIMLRMLDRIYTVSPLQQSQ